MFIKCVPVLYIIESVCLAQILATNQPLPRDSTGSPSTTSAPEAASAGVGAGAGVVVQSLCGLITNLPSGLDAGRRTGNTPVRDQLDDYITNKTGCRYESRGYSRSLQLGARAGGGAGAGVEADAGTFQGTPLVHRVAVRTEYDAVFTLVINNTLKYIISAGYIDNQRSVLKQYQPEKVVSSVSTPDLLSPHHYVPFYVSLDADKLSFGKECGPDPLFEHKLDSPLARGTPVHMNFVSGSFFGAKLLVDCPRLQHEPQTLRT